jgi:hypothetical protein
LVES